MPVYLTDCAGVKKVSEDVRHEATFDLPDDVSSHFWRSGELRCCASSDEMRDRLCADYGVPVLEREEHTFQNGDRAIVGSWGPDGKPHWAVRSFGVQL